MKRGLFFGFFVLLVLPWRASADDDLKDFVVDIHNINKQERIGMLNVAVQKQDVKRLESLLKKEEFRKYVNGNDQWNPLLLRDAAEEGNLEVVKLLVEAGAKINHPVWADNLPTEPGLTAQVKRGKNAITITRSGKQTFSFAFNDSHSRFYIDETEANKAFEMARKMVTGKGAELCHFVGNCGYTTELDVVYRKIESIENNLESFRQQVKQMDPRFEFAKEDAEKNLSKSTEAGAKKIEDLKAVARYLESQGAKRSNLTPEEFIRTKEARPHALIRLHEGELQLEPEEATH